MRNSHNYYWLMYKGLEGSHSHIIFSNILAINQWEKLNTCLVGKNSVPILVVYIRQPWDCFICWCGYCTTRSVFLNSDIFSKGNLLVPPCKQLKARTKNSIIFYHFPSTSKHSLELSEIAELRSHTMCTPFDNKSESNKIRVFAEQSIPAFLFLENRSTSVVLSRKLLKNIPKLKFTG